MQEAPNQVNLLCNLQLGVLRIYLDAADKAACKVWTSPSLGFTVISEATFMDLYGQYTLEHNERRNGLERCIKLLPPMAELQEQVFNSQTALLVCNVPNINCMPSTTMPSTTTSSQAFLYACQFSTHEAGCMHLITVSSPACYMQEQPHL